MFTQLTVSQSWFLAFLWYPNVLSKYFLPFFPDYFYCSSCIIIYYIYYIYWSSCKFFQTTASQMPTTKTLCCPISLKFLIPYQALTVSSTNIATLQLTACNLRSLHINLFCSDTKRMRMIKQTTDSFQKFFIFPQFFFLIKFELKQINSSITILFIKIASWETWRF